MTEKVYDLAVVTGTYQKDGQEKKRYQNVGVVLKTANGFFMLLDQHFNPAGIQGKDGRIAISMFEPEERQSGNNSGPQRTGGGGDYSSNTGTQSNDFLDDDVPFVSRYGLK